MSQRDIDALPGSIWTRIDKVWSLLWLVFCVGGPTWLAWYLHTWYITFICVCFALFGVGMMIDYHEVVDGERWLIEGPLGRGAWYEDKR